MEKNILKFEKCPICRSTKIQTDDNGRTFKVICRSCGNFVESTDTTPIATEKHRKMSASIAWNGANRIH